MSEVWLVIAHGVYDQGVWLVASSRAEAEAFCAKHSPDRDGYHDWYIQRHEVGKRAACTEVCPPHPKTKTWHEDAQQAHPQA